MTNLFRLSILIVVLSLSGCLSGGGDDDGGGFTSPPPPTPPPSNTAPVISGTPPTAIKVDEAYSFTPSASDADGDKLTFSIQNQPSWADFDTETGNISGTPTLGDVGSYAGIQISVSDGQATSSMSNFTIDVTQVATASTTLSWSAPTLNEDGSALTDLAGYRIYYGKSSRNYSNTIQIDDPGMTTYVVENLSPDTYYFAATAFNESGVESRYSGEAVKTLN
jgi:hypothetical protein